jgi:tRNA-Thr(GGU) m(6)t(6)A37 methyltransferase TsaA
MLISLTSMGVIHTPYQEDAPYQDYENKAGDFYIDINPDYTEGLYLLDSLTYCYILFHIHKQKKPARMHVFPPRGNGKEVGLFATRSPNRVNPIGLTVARIKKVEKNRIYTGGLDILNGTPLIDIKPYIRDFDCKEDANMGWVDLRGEQPEKWKETPPKGIK